MRVSKQVVVSILILLLTVIVVNFPIHLVQATYVEYPDLEYHLWDNLASSLYVFGTVILYEHLGFDGENVQFTNAYVNLDDHDFDDKASSLKVDGKVKLYDEPNWSGQRVITFRSDLLPTWSWGTQWNQNHLLTENSDKWDSRVWSWGLDDLYIEGPDPEKHINWTSDGLVESKATDHPLGGLIAVNFDQGWEDDVITDRCPDLPIDVSSLKVHGTVTLYDEPNYQLGNQISFTDARIVKLSDYGWDDRAQSLIVDGTVTIWEDNDFGGSHMLFTRVSAQTTPLKVSETSDIRLEGVVSDWWWDWFTPEDHTNSWQNGKFDIHPAARAVNVYDRSLFV